MRTGLADITLHIDETLDQQALLGLEDKMRHLGGVKNIHVETARPHLMVVGYDPEGLNSHDILGYVQHQGLHAELIGL